MFQKLCYDNKDALSAGIIVAGWDKEAGPSVYNIPLGGGLFRQPWAIGGMRSLRTECRAIDDIHYDPHRLWIDICVRLLRCDVPGGMGP